MIAAGNDGVHHEPSEVSSNLAAVAVLEAEDHSASPAGERHGRMHAVGARLRTGAHEGKPTGGAHRSPRGVTTSTTNLEHHGTKCDQGVSQSSRTTHTIVRVTLRMTHPIETATRTGWDADADAHTHVCVTLRMTHPIENATRTGWGRP